MAKIAEGDEVFESIGSALCVRDDVMCVEHAVGIAFVVAADLAAAVVAFFGLFRKATPLPRGIEVHWRAFCPDWRWGRRTAT